MIAAWVAYQQAQIARSKLKLDLFDKRMAVYEAVRTALGAAASRGKLTQEEEIAYMVGTRPAQWLFGPEVFKYLDETLWRKIVDLGLHNSMSEGSHSDERTKHIYAKAETMQWLVAQYKEFDRICADYLSLRH